MQIELPLVRLDRLHRGKVMWWSDWVGWADWCWCSLVSWGKLSVWWSVGAVDSSRHSPWNRPPPCCQEGSIWWHCMEESVALQSTHNTLQPPTPPHPRVYVVVTFMALSQAFISLGYAPNNYHAVIQPPLFYFHFYLYIFSRTCPLQIWLCLHIVTA